MELTGGMGNQLFQYALGRQLAIKNDTELKLDLSFFKTYDWHEYSLAPFNIQAKIATEEELWAVKGNYPYKWQRIIFKLKNKFYKKFETIIENGLEYHTYITNVGNNTYLKGYWQSEKYFKNIKDILTHDLKITIEPSVENKDIINQTQDCNAISLHIRRGVYVSVPEVNKFHGVKSLSYYMEALEFIKNNVIEPHIFIFSDEIEWAKENLKINIPHTFVDQNNDKTDYEDIRMMSMCKHHILANSTFSWWAAWLNANPDKIVIAPKKWFNDATINTQDLIPESWLRI